MGLKFEDLNKSVCTCNRPCIEHPPRPYSYDRAKNLWRSILTDADILCGNAVGGTNGSWQDVAGTLSVNLRVLASAVEQARKGNVVDGPVVFPGVEGSVED